MKKVKLTLTTAAMVFTAMAYAQSNVKITQLATETTSAKTSLKSIQFTTGAAWDKYKNLNMDMLADKTVNMPEYQSKTSSMEKSFQMQAIGLNTGVNLIWAKPQLSNDMLAAELRTGAAINLMKESLIEYHNRESGTRESLMYCFVENDIKFNTDLLFRIGDQSKFSLYSGIGVNASGSFGNELLVFSNYFVNQGVMNEFTPQSSSGEQNTFTGKNVIYARAYIPIGFSMKLFRHFETSAELKLGRGMEQVVGGSASTFKTGDFSFGLRYNIQRNTAPSIFSLLL